PQAFGFPGLKGDFLFAAVQKYATNNRCDLVKGYHFAGYAKINAEFIEFFHWFKQNYAFSLAPIYTGNMFYGITYLIHQGFFPENSKILAIHTGGLQGLNSGIGE